MSELTEIPFSGVVIGTRGLFCRMETTEHDHMAVHRNARRPFAVILSPVHTFETTTIPYPKFSVHRVLGGSAFSEILPSIIQRIVVLMIALVGRVTPRKEAMHRDSRPTISWLTQCVKSLCCFIERSKPIPTRKPIKIPQVDDRVLPLRKWDQSVRLVKRLRHCMTLHAAFHRSTSNGLVFLSRYCTTAILLSLLAFSVTAQSVSLTGAVQDTPDNQVWSNGTISFTFFGPQGTNYRWTGGTLNPNTPITGTLSSTGTYSVSVPDNSQITPTDSSWIVTVCPAILPAVSGCFKTNKVITSASTTLNLTPSSPRFSVPLSPASISPITAYNDSEISGGWVGFTYYNLTANSSRNCTAVSATGCTSWAAAGGGNPTPGSQISFGNTVSPLAYGAKWDVKFVYDATYSNGSATVTCPNSDCNFTSADVGKIVVGFEGPWSSNNNVTLYASLITNQGTVLPTILSVNGAQSITLSTTATQNCVANAANTNVCTLAWGTQDDTTAINNAMVAAWETTGACKALELPSGAAFISAGVLNATISQLSSSCGGQQGTTGGIDLNQTGPEVYGQGPNNTSLIPLPTYNFASCTNGANANVCNLGTPNLEAHDFAINGLANSVPTAHSVALASLEGSTGGASCTGSTGFNLTFANWAVQSTGSTGLQLGIGACGDPMYQNIVSELFGAQNCSVSATFVMTMYAVACFGATNAQSAVTFNVGGSSAVLTSNNGFYGNNMSGNNNVQISVTGGGVFNSKGDLILTNYSNPISMVRVPNSAQQGTINIDGDIITVPASTAGLSYALLLQGTGGPTNVHVRGTSIVATGANNRVLLSSATNNLFDDGGNTWANGSQAWSVGGGFIADGHSIKGTCTGVANASQATQSMYGTGPNVTGTTCAAQTATVGTGLQVSGPRTLQNLVVSSSATTVAITVTVTVNGSNSTITCTMTAATSCVDTTHSVALNDGDLVSIKYSTGAAETGANLKAIVEWQ